MILAKLFSKLLECFDELSQPLSSYAHSELMKDIDKELSSRPETEQPVLRAATKFGVFVGHNKLKTKLAELPSEVLFVI